MSSASMMASVKQANDELQVVQLELDAAVLERDGAVAVLGEERSQHRQQQQQLHQQMESFQAKLDSAAVASAAKVDEITQRHANQIMELQACSARAALAHQTREKELTSKVRRQKPTILLILWHTSYFMAHTHEEHLHTWTSAF
eukprot:SAG11_NODE_8819_length_973_cov_1.306636_1_plen_144_part_00